MSDLSQEHDLLRAFRARMYDVTMQLEKERNQKDDGSHLV